MKFIVLFILIFSLNALGDCPTLSGNIDINSVAPLLPANPQKCLQEFYQEVLENSRSYCPCFNAPTALDQFTNTTAISSEEQNKLDQMVEDFMLEQVRAQLESFFTTTLSVDGYLKRGAMDPRFLANMRDCRMSGLFNKIKKYEPGQCNQQKYIERLSKIFNVGESDLRTALATEAGTKSLLDTFVNQFQTGLTPYARNFIPEDLKQKTCLPYKTTLMLASAPLNSEHLDAMLRFGGLAGDREGKRNFLGHVLNANSLGKKYYQDSGSAYQFLLEDQNFALSRATSHLAQNHPLMLLAFNDPAILGKFTDHRQSVDSCRGEQTSAFNDAMAPILEQKTNERLTTLLTTCTQPSTLEDCREKKTAEAEAYAKTQIPTEEQWRISQNRPACKSYEDFFQDQKNVNDILKSNNDACKTFRDNLAEKYLCPEDLSHVTPEKFKLTLAPKIYAQFGDQAPRILRHYVKKHFCKQSRAGALLPIAVSPTEEIGLINPLRPRSDLTDIRLGQESNYERINKQICPILKGRLPGGAEFSCHAEVMAASPDTNAICENPLAWKHMACKSMQRLANSANPPLTNFERQDFFTKPELFTNDPLLFRFPMSTGGKLPLEKSGFPMEENADNPGPETFSHILELQRLANSLPGNLPNSNPVQDNFCALPNPFPETTNVATASVPSQAISWMRPELNQINNGSGPGNQAENQDLSFFTDYFLAGSESDQQALETYAAVNPAIANGDISSSTGAGELPPIPYTRRIEITTPPPSNALESANASSPPISEAPPPSENATSSSTIGEGPNRDLAATSNRINSTSSRFVEAARLEEYIPTKIAPTPTATPLPSKAEVKVEDEDRLKDLEKRLAALKAKEEELKRLERENELAAIRAERERLERERDELVAEQMREKLKTKKSITDNSGGTNNTISSDINRKGSLETNGNTSTIAQGKAGSAPKRADQLGAGQSAANKGVNAKDKSALGEKSIASNSRGPASKNSYSLGLKDSYLTDEGGPIAYEGKVGGIPGLKEIHHHMPFESPIIIFQELIYKFGLKKVIEHFSLEGKTFSAFAYSKGKKEMGLLTVYSFNPKKLSKKDLEGPEEVQRRLRLEKLIVRLKSDLKQIYANYDNAKTQRLSASDYKKEQEILEALNLARISTRKILGHQIVTDKEWVIVQKNLMTVEEFQRVSDQLSKKNY